jgi:hypothetical protein
MKPIKKKKTIEKEYWFCGDDNHSHMSEFYAQMCIDKMAKRKPKIKPKINNFECARMVLNGSTYQDVAKIRGITATSVMQKFNNIIRKSRKITDISSVPDHAINAKKISDFRKNKEYWNNQILILEISEE